MAGKVIGFSLHLAIESAIRLERMTQRGALSRCPHKQGFDQDAWSLLQMMLIEERRLIEFTGSASWWFRAGRHHQCKDVLFDGGAGQVIGAGEQG